MRCPVPGGHPLLIIPAPLRLLLPARSIEPDLPRVGRHDGFARVGCAGRQGGETSCRRIEYRLTQHCRVESLKLLLHPNEFIRVHVSALDSQAGLRIITIITPTPSSDFASKRRPICCAPQEFTILESRVEQSILFSGPKLKLPGNSWRRKR